MIEFQISGTTPDQYVIFELCDGIRIRIIWMTCLNYSDRSCVCNEFPTNCRWKTSRFTLHKIIYDYTRTSYLLVI